MSTEDTHDDVPETLTSTRDYWRHYDNADRDPVMPWWKWALVIIIALLLFFFVLAPLWGGYIALS